MTKLPMTTAGYSVLQDELNQRMAVERPRLIQRMREAQLPTIPTLLRTRSTTQPKRTN